MTTATLDTEIEGAVVAPGAALTPYAGGAVEEYRPKIVMAPEDAKALDEALRENMKAVLRENVDYGVIPGTGSKPSLLKPGAEKLLQWFGFGHTMEQVETERDSAGTWQGVTYRCTVTKAMPDGRVVAVGTCEGYAGYDEDRFYLSAEAATAKEHALAERYRRNVNPSKCVEYRAPRNSVIKMAQKRALVGAALQATSASTLFTQDVEDTAEPAPSAAVDAGAAIATEARPVIAALPKPAREGLDKWYRAQQWPSPSKWDAAQWCAALVQVGKLTASAEAVDGIEGRVVPRPAHNAPAAGVTDQEWLTDFTTRALVVPDLDAHVEAWGELENKEEAGECSAADANRLREILSARLEEIQGAGNGAAGQEALI